MSAAGTPLGADESARDGRLITDFSDDGADLGWYVVNDNVMGGRSEGGFELQRGVLLFSGRTNTRGGGFSSIRTAPLQLDLSQYAAIRLRVSGDGRRYTWRLTTDARYYGRPVAYWADFETVGGDWQTVDVPFSRFVPRFRGAELDGPPLDTSAITGMGLMIYDKRDGAFELRLASIRAVADDAPFSLDRYQWRKRVLVVSAPGDDEHEMQDQLEAVSTTRDAFEERDMVLVVLRNDAASTAGDRVLTAEEVAATRRTLDIAPDAYALRLVGKDGTVKLSRGEAVPMTDIYDLIDSMPMRQREMEER